MRNSVKLTSIDYSDEGRKIIYHYTFDKAIAKYFNPKESFFVSYKEDVSQTPQSIAVIPFLANLAPIAWFAGFDIEVDELDADFFESLNEIRSEFRKNFKELVNVNSVIKANKLLKNKTEGNQCAMLFSGGVDAYATYFRNQNQNLDLVTIHGADIELNDFVQWNTVIYLNENENLLKKNKKHYVTSNLRTFYSYKVDLLLDDLGWWGTVQHGLALNAIIAPLAIKYKFKTIYIASSFTDNINIVWGSTPEIDNKIKWAGTSVIHDGYSLKRQEKVNLIVNEVKNKVEKIKLRVCYSEINIGMNCSKCEKCYRTILGIILSNDNPNDYGFSTDEKVYDSVLKYFNEGFSSKGVRYFWQEISEKMSENTNFFIFSNKEMEQLKMKVLNDFILTSLDNKSDKKVLKIRAKYKIINKFPKLFKFYLTLRRKL